MNLLGRKLHLSAIALLVIGMAPVQLRAQITNSFTDNFNRANVDSTTNGSLIGPDYVITSNTGDGYFSIEDNQLRTRILSGANRVLSYQGFQAENTGGSEFTASIKITLGAYNAGINPGLAFNFQDANNFYWARLGSQTAADAGNGFLQFGQIVAGTSTSFTGANLTNLNLATNIAYTLSIASSAAGLFTYGLTGGTLNLNGNFSDNVAGGDFSNGYVGIYQNTANSNTQWDDFSVVAVVPEPSTASLLILCGLVGGAFIYKRKRKSSAGG
jgi:hypothetical protein